MRARFQTALLLLASLALTLTSSAHAAAPTKPVMLEVKGSVIAHDAAAMTFSVAAAKSSDPARAFTYDKSTLFTQDGVAATPAALRIGLMARVGYITPAKGGLLAKVVDVTKAPTQ